ncbi:MAG: RNA polymerase sigma factor [Flavobacteriia bacterium]|nr:RNA polymerase sigma factor [Flavobacteriia bacterium]
MKIISIHKNRKTEEMVRLLIKGDRLAQKEVFERYSPKMLSVCRTYTGDLHNAEDCMIRAFVKVFKSISSYSSIGSLEGWIRRIMVNECLDFLRANKNFVFLDEIDFVEEPEDEQQDLSGIDAGELLDSLPENYRMVFNLFVLEDYSHKEISKILNIDEMTSRTQLSRAKKRLREIIVERKQIRDENRA